MERRALPEHRRLEHLEASGAAGGRDLRPVDREPDDDGYRGDGAQDQKRTERIDLHERPSLISNRELLQEAAVFDRATDRAAGYASVVPNLHEMVASALLEWYGRGGRDSLPWRRDRAPYRIVVSEFMLQQTQVSRVVPLFEAFVSRWPGFSALAAASRDDVVRAWRGLGYNSRAVRLHELARAVVARGGELQRTELELCELPGVGPYTAAAIAAFAFDIDAIAFDTNVRRIVHRVLLGVEWPPLASDARLAELARELLPSGRAFAFNSALMDLGATLCTARAPKCLLCPLASRCAAAPVDGASLAARSTEHASPRSPQARLPFERTRRFARGRIVDRLRELAPRERIVASALISELREILVGHDLGAIESAIANLARDGIVTVDTFGVCLASGEESDTSVEATRSPIGRERTTR